MAKPILAFLATNVRNYAAREVESKALIADSNLWTIWILNSFHRGESLAQCSNLSGWVVEAMTDGIQLTLSNKRFISLNVYDNVPIAANLLDSFFDAVGTALMVGAGHDSLAAKCFNSLEDAFVVSSNVCFFQYCSHFFINMLYNWLAAQHSERLARETRRGVSCWYNSYEFHNLILFIFIVNAYMLITNAKVQYYFVLTKLFYANYTFRKCLFIIIHVNILR